LQGNSTVIPVYILDEHLLEKPAVNRQAFLFAGMRSLEVELNRLGSVLVVRRGNPELELPRLVAESGATSVYAEMDISPYARQRDAAIAGRVDLHLVHGSGFYPPTAVRQPDGRPYKVFTPFSRVWKALPFNQSILPAPSVLSRVPDLYTEHIPDTPTQLSYPVGGLEARHRLETFLDGPIFAYREMRDRMDLAGTSQLSASLRFGMLSVRQAVVFARLCAEIAPDEGSKAGCEAWLNELIWRDFYQAILYHYPDVLKSAFKPNLRDIPWRDAPYDLHAWQTGQTGYPVVDAAMRQMAASGWMHNRARMIAASFLVKHLLINWQDGERWFMQQLVDGDPSSNNGGWQWVAGTGTDAAPYFRIFNPVLQGRKYDPFGNYVRRWVPELDSVPDRFIHNPWEMTGADQQDCGVIIGRDYPTPIVEHAFARARVMAAYKSLNR
jgi:deoxyribodipyrimidine photo-lyase